MKEVETQIVEKTYVEIKDYIINAKQQVYKAVN